MDHLLVGWIWLEVVGSREVLRPAPRSSTMERFKTQLVFGDTNDSDAAVSEMEQVLGV
jgi:hypothetical protein